MEKLAVFRVCLTLFLVGGTACSGGSTSPTPNGAGGSGTGGHGTGGSATGGSPSGGTGGAGGVAAGSGGSAGTTGSGGRDAGSDTATADGGDAGAADRPVLPARVLLYSFSTLAIASVPTQLAFFRAQLEAWNYQVDESVDPAKFTDAGLASYAAVAMINTCFSPFGATSSGVPEAQALQRFVRRGGGLFGTHCADVTYQSLPVASPALYNQLLGGRGNNGSFEGTSTCRRVVADHPTTVGLPATTFSYTGNIDNVDYTAPSTVVLVRCLWPSGNDDPVSWYRTEELGRVFYTSFAKEAPDLTNPTIGTPHIVAGLGWVLRR